MSHLDSIAVSLTDLNALRTAAVGDFGCQWIEGKKTFEFYGKYVGDTPMPMNLKGIKPGTCDHVIKIPGVNYEVGVVKLKDGTYTLAYDYYNDGGRHDGHKILEKFGLGCKKLIHAYSTHKTMNWARSKGWMVNKVPLPNGRVALDITGVGL